MDIYLLCLQAIEYLLDRVYEKYWRDWISADIALWEEHKDVTHHLNAYGGMGSFNDLTICEMNGHKIDAFLEPFVQILLNWLQNFCYTLAKNSEKATTTEKLKKKVNDYGVPTSAFIEQSETILQYLKEIECDNNLEGWHCLTCGFSEVDQKSINYYIAQLILPKILFDACIQKNLISIIDDIFSDSIPDKQEIDLLIKKLMAKNSINFIPRRSGGMTACPACSSNNTIIYKWAIKLESSED